MGLDFARTCARLDHLHGEVEAGRFGHKVVVSKVEDDAESDAAFMAFARDRWPRFDPFRIKRDGWLGYVEPGSPRIPDLPCGRWFELSVMATGKVALCCMDGTGEYAIGDVNEQSLAEIYNAPGWRARRERMISRRGIHPCSTCTY
jgi:radical SAM protein with 4Fe4S-binding SPASM domain